MSGCAHCACFCEWGAVVALLLCVCVGEGGWCDDAEGSSGNAKVDSFLVFCSRRQWNGAQSVSHLLQRRSLGRVGGQAPLHQGNKSAKPLWFVTVPVGTGSVDPPRDILSIQRRGIHHRHTTQPNEICGISVWSEHNAAFRTPTLRTMRGDGTGVSHQDDEECADGTLVEDSTHDTPDTSGIMISDARYLCKETCIAHPIERRPATRQHLEHKSPKHVDITGRCCHDASVQVAHNNLRGHACYWSQRLIAKQDGSNCCTSTCSWC